MSLFLKIFLPIVPISEVSGLAGTTVHVSLHLSHCREDDAKSMDLASSSRAGDGRDDVHWRSRPDYTMNKGGPAAIAMNNGWPPPYCV